MPRPFPIAAAVALSASLALPASALAGPNEGLTNTPVVIARERVPYGDLDLNSPQGASAMLRRIRAAAERACEQPRSPLFPTVQTTMANCAAASVGEAVASLNSPLVLAEFGRAQYPPVRTAAGAR